MVYFLFWSGNWKCYNLRNKAIKLEYECNKELRKQAQASWRNRKFPSWILTLSISTLSISDAATTLQQSTGSFTSLILRQIIEVSAYPLRIYFSSCKSHHSSSSNQVLYWSMLPGFSSVEKQSFQSHLLHQNMKSKKTSDKNSSLRQGAALT